MKRFKLSGIEPDESAYGLDEIQYIDHPSHEAAAQALFRALGAHIRRGRDTTSLLKIYPLADLFGLTREEVEETLRTWLTKIGWRYMVFGPDEYGSGWSPPDFRTWGYHNRTVWIYQPGDPRGSFRDYAYTLAWRVTHEIAHALVNDALTVKYEALGRRAGMLGRPKRYEHGVRPFVAEPLTLGDALRALEWEHWAFQKQRELLEGDFGIAIGDDEFAKENLVNLADATYRVLTGEFSSPGALGVEPRVVDPDEVLRRAIGLVCDAAATMGIGTEGRLVLVSRFHTEIATAGRARDIRVTVPLPVTDERGLGFPPASVAWFESRLMALAGGFRKHVHVLGTWDHAGVVQKEEVAVYEVTMPVEVLEEVEDLLASARAVFRQKVILTEATPVEKLFVADPDRSVSGLPTMLGAAR